MDQACVREKRESVTIGILGDQTADEGDIDLLFVQADELLQPLVGAHEKAIVLDVDAPDKGHLLPGPDEFVNAVLRVAAPQVALAVTAPEKVVHAVGAVVQAATA